MAKAESSTSVCHPDGVRPTACLQRPLTGASLAGNSVIILTSNLGARFLTPCADSVEMDAATISEEARAAVMADVRAHFRPEFLNRLDETVVFHRLAPAHLRRIVQQLVDDMAVPMEKNDGIKLLVTHEVTSLIPTAAAAHCALTDCGREAWRC